ncbi:MAG: hypothetical protein ABUT39_22490 [Acidobacteriota bacterium]
MSPVTLTQCRTKALSLYQSITADPNFNGSNYWQIGCVFDTMTDYLQQDAGFPDPNVTVAEVDAFIRNTYDHYQSLTQQGTTAPNQACFAWYDDFGWWGIASAKAFLPSYAQVFLGYAREYQKIALSTWEIMKNGKLDEVHFGAPNAWTRCDQTTFAICEPRFPGGVWQYDIFADQRPYEAAPFNPSTPIAVGNYQPATLGPYQMSVVNGLYFVLANRLQAAGYERPETTAAIFGFFNSWFHDLSLDDKTRLNLSVNGGQLILERVSTYKDPNNKVYWADGTTCWGGDQGLVFGALAEYKRQHGGPAWIDDMLTAILGGVATSMSSGSYMMPWYPLQNNKLQTADAGDYSSGVGVYMRYLNQAYGFDSLVQTSLDTAQNPMRELVLDSAQTVCDGNLPDWGNPLFASFNELAILVAAISLLKNS